MAISAPAAASHSSASSAGSGGSSAAARRIVSTAGSCRPSPARRRRQTAAERPRVGQTPGTRAGLGFTALANGFATCPDPARLQQVCDLLGPADLWGCFDRWIAVIPTRSAPLTGPPGTGRGLSMRQVEVSRTIVFDVPRRPCLLRGADRRQHRGGPARGGVGGVRPPGPQDHPRCVPHAGVHPGQARPGLQALPGQAMFARISQPYAWEGQRTGALRFGDPRAMALAGALCMVVHAVAGFSNRSLRALVAGLLGTTYTASQMTYDLRRLRRHGLIQRRPGTNTYLPPSTASGWRCSTPRSTTGCWRRCWPPTTHRHHPRSATPYAWSTRPWPTPSPAHAWEPPLETCHNVSSPGPQEGLGPGGNQASDSPASLTRPRAGLRERTRTRARGRCRTRAGAAGWR